MARRFLLPLLVLLLLMSAGCGYANGEVGVAPPVEADREIGSGPPSGSTVAPSDGASDAPFRDEELIVSAAATLRAAFTELAGRFEESTGARVVLNFAASGTLQRQIEGGAPADLFASAAEEQVKALLDEGLVDARSVRAFAGNAVVLIAPQRRDGLLGFTDLAGPEVRRVATGNPETAPHGERSMEVLESLGILEEVEARLIFTENVAQTLDYVARGEVDAGLLFLTEALRNDAVRIVEEAPAGAHRPIRHVLGVTRDTARPRVAAAFADFVMSEQGQSVLCSYGFRNAP